MNVVFRTDASLDIGTGHVMRCLTLAAALREQGAQCRFVCREHPGNLIARVRDDGFAVTVLPMELDAVRVAAAVDAGSRPEHAGWLGASWRTDADATRAELETSPPDWLVVDHYGLDSRWERHVRPACKCLMAIDDLADRAHDCNLLLDQTLGRDEGDYAALVPVQCQLCVGPRYALLRPEFAALRTASLQRRVTPECRNLLVAMGGIDRLNATGRVLAALPRRGLPPDCNIIVVMGSHAPWLDDVRRQAQTLPWSCEVRVDVKDMAALMRDCDLAIGAAGSSAWERCVLGVPSLVVVTARNQERIATAIGRAGAAQVVGGVESIERRLPSMCRGLTSGQRLEMSRAAAGVCDGRGAARTINAMLTCGVSIRRMRDDDLAAVLEWRNHPDVRCWMYSSGEIGLAEHREWFAAAQKNPRRHLLIVEEQGVPLGFVQFTEKKGDGSADWGFYAVPGAPRGSGRKLGIVALDYAFTRLGLRKIHGEAIATNERSAAFHRKLGFAEDVADHKRAGPDCGGRAALGFSLAASDWPGR